MFSWNRRSQLSVLVPVKSVRFFSCFFIRSVVIIRGGGGQRQDSRGFIDLNFFTKKMKISSILHSLLLSGGLSMALIEAVRRHPAGAWWDVCCSAAAATSLCAPPPPPLLLFWQLADDNRWWALITSSQRKMNSYPASSAAIFTVREAGS